MHTICSRDGLLSGGKADVGFVLSAIVSAATCTGSLMMPDWAGLMAGACAKQSAT
jgi:hypothetical protein